MKVVKLEVYGDFDVPITESVWISDVDIKLDLNAFDNDSDTKKAEQYLKSLGFKKVKTTSLTVGGNL